MIPGPSPVPARLRLVPRWLSVCTFVGTALAVLGGCGGGRDSDTAPAPEGATAPAGPPSIVLVSLDTTRADRLGCYGYAGAETPTLDALAAAGVVFEETSSPAPITLPAHASLMTGLGPHRHGVRDNGLHRLPDDLDTLGTILRARGYATAAVVGAAVLDRQYGLDAGFATWDDRMGGGALLAIPERDAAAVTDAALAAAADLEPPFLLFVHYFDPHADYRPPPPFAERFRDRPYDGEIAFVDRELGRLLDGLRAAGALDGAVVSVVADHGESLGEHGERAHGVLLYRSTLRVPWILSAPGRLPAGRRVATFARLTDVMPTLVELAGASAPSGLDGTSLVAAARGTAATPDTPWLRSSPSSATTPTAGRRCGASPTAA